MPTPSFKSSFCNSELQLVGGPFYHLGIKIYDFMSGNLGIGSSKGISVEEMINYIPTIDQKELKGGIVYFDGQFDDARMAISLAKTAG